LENIRGVKNNNWQRNYSDHIIRDSHGYFLISIYIIENAEKWENDRLNDEVARTNK